MRLEHVLINGDCTRKSDGLLHVLGATGAQAGASGVIMVTDPPYTDTRYTRSVLRRNGKVLARRISYGALTPKLRKTIAAAAAIVEWSAIWDRPEGMGQWRREIVRAGGVWCGVGLVLQTRGAPRFQGDAPGCRMLCLALARRKGRAKWKGRPWAEWFETRSSTDRPIVGTRSIETARQVVADLAASCADGCGLVIDPCAGTGIIMAAALAEGYSAIGFERDGETHAYAARLLAGRAPAGEDGSPSGRQFEL